MENAAYLLGQLLHISDELHAMYCQIVRKGDSPVPPQLAGNALFVAASDTPAPALAQLSKRMMPYIAWAKQYRTKGIECDKNDPQNQKDKGKESWRAGWLLHLYADVAGKLALALQPNMRFDSYEKAQLYLGYLASLSTKDEPAQTTNKPTNKKSSPKMA